MIDLADHWFERLRGDTPADALVGEFIAGYFEMFFRNPHAFAQANPALFDSFALLLGCDQRPAWPANFPDYVAANRHFYLHSGEQPWPTRLTLPDA